MPKAQQAVTMQLDALVGPTHHYAGLGLGNVASQQHRAQPSNPRAAALQGLEKAWYWTQLGVPQAILPPQRRPRLDFLRQLGFYGSDAEVIERAHAADAGLLSASYSASFMWAANAATVTPAVDALDRRVHFTPANLLSGLHRSLEAEETRGWLTRLFPGDAFSIHRPLPASWPLRDEGAANHTRFATGPDAPGLHLFVHGDWTTPGKPRPQSIPARQTRRASQCVARRHQLPPDQCLDLQQHPDAIQAGVFHNDVIAVGHETAFLVHEAAFATGERALAELQHRARLVLDCELTLVTVSNEELPLADAVSSYLFNSQWVTLPSGRQRLLCPSECQQNPKALACLERIQAELPQIEAIDFLDLTQSMHNGGGPACLRLRVELSPEAQDAVDPRAWLNAENYQALRQAIQSHYRDCLTLDDLRDPSLIDEARRAHAAILSALGWDDATSRAT